MLDGYHRRSTTRCETKRDTNLLVKLKRTHLPWRAWGRRGTNAENGAVSFFVLSQVRNVELERQIKVMVGRVANKVFPKYQQDNGVQDKQATWEEARVALNLNHR